MKKDRIEEVYGELETFSKAPPAELWDKIETRLHSKKKKRGLLFFWGSAAAIVLMLFGYIFTNSIKPNTEPINEISNTERPVDDNSVNELNKKTTIIVEGVDVNNGHENSLVNEDPILKKPSIKKELLKPVTNQKQLSDRTGILEKKEGRINSVSEKEINNVVERPNYYKRFSQNNINDAEDKIDNKDNPDLRSKNKSVSQYEKDNRVASNDSISNVKDVILLGLSEELVYENETIRDSTIINTEARLKWSVEVLGGLTNTNPSGSSIQGASVNATSQNDFVYALKVGYAFSDRLIVKSGIGKNILGQEIKNLKYVSSETTGLADNYQNIVNNQNILFLLSQDTFNDISSEAVVREGALQQKLDYIQVPLEFSYNFLKGKKYNLSLGIAGNINFLTNNRVFLNNEHIGENVGVDATVFGATLNSNISYEMTKKMILFFEPSYNYFDKPIDNNNQAFNNTQLRVLFGLRYKF